MAFIGLFCLSIILFAQILQLHHECLIYLLFEECIIQFFVKQFVDNWAINFRFKISYKRGIQVAIIFLFSCCILFCITFHVLFINNTVFDKDFVMLETFWDKMMFSLSNITQSHFNANTCTDFGEIPVRGVVYIVW